MSPPLLLQETQPWVRPLNLPCMTMVAVVSSASVAATKHTGRTSSRRPVQPRWPARLGPPCPPGHVGNPGRISPQPERRHLSSNCIGQGSATLCFLRPDLGPRTASFTPPPSASIRQRFHGGLASDTHRMLAPPPSRIDSCLPEILGARLPLMPCPSVHPRRHDPSGLYISMSGHRR